MLEKNCHNKVQCRVAIAEDTVAIKQNEHISADCLAVKISRQEVYVALYDGVFAGWLRYGMLWDNIPLMNMLFLLPEYRGKGIGKQLVLFWEDQMRAQGYKIGMTSTQQNESAQHFYLHLGYQTIGGFTLPGDTYELIMVKQLD